jgi:uncharacterized membrane protein
MLNKIKNLQANEWFIITMVMLFITDLTILLDLPFLRDITPFLFFTIIPGFLIITILKQHRIKFIIKFMLSIGLSLSLLMIIGLLLNALYPFLSKPLSLTPLLLTLNIVLLILTIFAFQGNKNNFNTSSIFNINFKLGDKLLSPIIFSFLFPFMAILGTYLMNTTQNNIILLTMLFLIPIYIVIIAYLKDRVHPVTYIISLYMIGLGLILMHSLTSTHLIGRDVFQEFNCFQLTLTNFHWNIDNFYNPYNACISITILPTIYAVITNLNGEYVFKLLFALVGSILPLMVYKIATKYLDKKYAFFAALLFVFQVFFIDIVGAVRQEVAILFFFIAIIVLFDCFGDSPFEKSWLKKSLFLVFVFSMIISHYATSYVAFGILVPILLLPFLKTLYKERKLTFTNFDVILIYLAFIILWFVLYAKVQFLAGSEVIASTVAATASGTGSGTAGFVSGREGTVLSVLGIGIRSIPNLLAVIANDLIFLTIGIGLVTILLKFRIKLHGQTLILYKEIRSMDTKLLLAVLLSVILLAMFIILPSVSFFYGSDRLFFQLLIFTSPFFVIGAIKIGRLLNFVIKKPDLKIVVILVLLISLFLCNTHLQYHFLGAPYSSEYDNTGITRGEAYIHDGEIATAQWLGTYHADDISVYTDSVGFTRLSRSGGNISVVGINFNNKTINGYLYLGNANVNEGNLYDYIDSQVSIKKYNYFFNGKNRIFADGYGQVWV